MQNTSSSTPKQTLLPTALTIKSEAGYAGWMCATGRKDTTSACDSAKVKDVTTWIGAQDALPAEFRLYDRLFTEEQPDAGGRDFLSVLNPHSLATTQGYVETSLASAVPEDRFQFERYGFFVADRVDPEKGEKLVFNRIAGLKNGWGK